MTLQSGNPSQHASSGERPELVFQETATVPQRERSPALLSLMALTLPSERIQKWSQRDGTRCLRVAPSSGERHLNPLVGFA